jgi:hypothetical protein
VLADAYDNVVRKFDGKRDLGSYSSKWLFQAASLIEVAISLPSRNAAGESQLFHHCGCGHGTLQ